jgi:hypothetical protein
MNGEGMGELRALGPMLEGHHGKMATAEDDSNGHELARVVQLADLTKIIRKFAAILATAIQARFLVSLRMHAPRV